MKYIEVSFYAEPDNELVRDIVPSLAGDIGFESFTEEDDCIKGYIQDTIFDATELDYMVENFPIPGVTLSYKAKEAEYKNWNEEWEKDSFKQVEIGDKLCLIHSSKTEDDASYKYNIRINPKMAFGSGTHETTSMLVEYISSLDLTDKHTFDMGCGTGILAIMTCLRGAAKVQAVDIDEWSVENSKENIELNGFTERISVHHGDASILPINNFRANLFVANINRNILLNDMDKYVKCIAKNGTLLVSGFYTDDVKMLEEKAATLGLTLEYSNVRNNWCMLAFKYSK